MSDHELINEQLKRGLELQQQGLTLEASLIYREILKKEPNNFDALHLLGVIAYAESNFQLAMNLFAEAIELQPTNFLFYFDCGNAYEGLNQLEAAISCYDKALALNPNYPDIHFNRGAAFQRLNQLEAAIACYDNVIALNPNHVNAYFNRGAALQGLGQLESAISCYDKALALNPNYADIHFNRGAAFQRLNQLEAAITCYDTVIALNPNHVNALWNKTLSLLLNGNFEMGWKLFQRGGEFNTRQVQQDYIEPLWLGEDSLAGKSILLHNEQGLGDTLQFCRYVKLVSNLGGRVILKAQKPLISLLSDLEGVSHLVAEGEEVPKFDFQCPLMSLPLAFKTEINTIPVSKKYIHSSPIKAQEWKNKLGEKFKPRIGIAWSSTSSFLHDSSRSMTLAELLLALPSGEFEYFCLQKEIKAIDKETLRLNSQIKFVGDELDDFSDTAALIENLDLVISTCTSIPHLSGALGKQTWLLLAYTPDWRWLLNREDTPWYPSTKLYRQSSSGDWTSVLQRVKTDLLRLNDNV